jgi:hypothetical protein
VHAGHARISAWGRTRADRGLRLDVASGNLRLRGLIFFAHLHHGCNLAALGLSEQGVHEIRIPHSYHPQEHDLGFRFVLGSRLAP